MSQERSSSFRAVFFGTPAIAVPALEALHAMAEVTCVVCQPDKPAGRGLELAAPAVKQRALALGLRVEQPAKIRTPEFARWLRDERADVALVMAYGRILPRELLEAPRAGCINLHASVLPKYRGAAPIQWAVISGERETGISLMQMDEGCDTGPIFTIRRLAIGADETSGELGERLAVLAARVVREDLPRALSGELRAERQPEGATAAPKLEKEHGLVDWRAPAARVHDLVRGVSPWPGAYGFAPAAAGRGGAEAAPRRLKLLETRLTEGEGRRGAPGQVLRIDRAGAEVACGTGSVLVVRAQLEGKKPLPAVELAAGRAIAVGAVLGGAG